MFIRLYKDVWINSKFIEKMFISYGDCRVGKAYSIVFAMNNGERLDYGYYETENEALSALKNLLEGDLNEH